MGRRRVVAAALAALAAGCEEDFLVVSDYPAAPEDLEGSYYARGVDLSWRLGATWSGAAFRVYGKRAQAVAFVLIGETTSCIGGWCGYRDANVAPGVVYEYYVSAVDPHSGLETESDRSVQVAVPHPVPPPVPAGLRAVALDDAVYLRWDDEASSEEDFAAYRVYQRSADEHFLLGETDSPGFVDLLAENGATYAYMVASLDEQGHESDRGEAASATPRPDFAGELVYAFADSAEASGFRFRDTSLAQAVVAGVDPARHFRLEADTAALWLVPGPGTTVHVESRYATALKCGPGSDSECVSWEVAPRTGYASAPIAVGPSLAYVFRTLDGGGKTRYGLVRIAFTGVDQVDRELIVFDWAYQTQPGNRSLDAGSSFR